MNVLLTRANKAAQRSAGNLRAAGHRPVILPLVETVARDAQIPGGHWDGILLTSAAAPCFLAVHQDANTAGKLLEIPVYCVGGTTEASARRSGFSRIGAVAPSGAALAEEIAGRIKTGALSQSPRLLYPGAVHRSFDFALALPTAETVKADIYEAVQIDPGRDRLSDALSRVRNGAVFAYSERSCRYFFELVGRHGLEAALNALTLVCISEKVAKSAPHRIQERCRIAKSPDEPAMIAELGE